MQSIVKITNLTKTFGEKNAVDDVCMNIFKGDIYGFIGRNGAGKTTLIRVLLGLANKTKGEIELFESKNLLEGRDKIGCIIENPGLFFKMTAKDNIIAQSKVLGVSITDDEIKELLDLVGLDFESKKKAKDFSLGMKQRLAIAIALVGNPKLLVLDEPTNGLDPEGIRDIRNLILKLNKERYLTVLISSHILSELHKLATRYAIIDNGKIVKEFSEKELLENAKKTFEIIVKTEDCEILKEFLNENNIKYEFESEKQKFKILSNIDSSQILKEISSKNIIPISYGMVECDLEKYFLEIIGGMKNE